ncbi:hypothetical protein [Streptomyces flavofungini]|uniref:hypothetical protein n=1 Tax=Streptomyces flavofungini TaxID=68200 RepID=UPI0025B12E01|nr:hypothetical protein [Streptomyces flavofungini]WJV48594.1 hypothetical protein QUY26_25610 [Streptomyces flavofungini]
MPTTVDRDKQLIRERVWDLLDSAGAVHDGSAHGRIPNFKGSSQAAGRLATLSA